MFEKLFYAAYVEDSHTLITKLSVVWVFIVISMNLLFQNLYRIRIALLFCKHWWSPKGKTTLIYICFSRCEESAKTGKLPNVSGGEFFLVNLTTDLFSLNLSGLFSRINSTTWIQFLWTQITRNRVIQIIFKNLQSTI